LTRIYSAIVVDNTGCEETQNLVDEYARVSNIYQYLAGEISGMQPSTQAVNYAGQEYAVALLSAVSCPRVEYLPALEIKGPAAARNTGWRQLGVRSLPSQTMTVYRIRWLLRKWQRSMRIRRVSGWISKRRWIQPTLDKMHHHPPGASLCPQPLYHWRSFWKTSAASMNAFMLPGGGYRPI
jgi:hypothetical protein